MNIVHKTYSSTTTAATLRESWHDSACHCALRWRTQGWYCFDCGNSGRTCYSWVCREFDPLRYEIRMLRDSCSCVRFNVRDSSKVWIEGIHVAPEKRLRGIASWLIKIVRRNFQGYTVAGLIKEYSKDKADANVSFWSKMNALIRPLQEEQDVYSDDSPVTIYRAEFCLN